MGLYWSNYTGYGRFSIRGQLQHTPKFSSKSVNSFEGIHWQTFSHRQLKNSFLDVSVFVESGNVLSSTSNFWRYFNTSIRSTDMEVKYHPSGNVNFNNLGIFQSWKLRTCNAENPSDFLWAKFYSKYLGLLWVILLLAYLWKNSEASLQFCHLCTLFQQ